MDTNATESKAMMSQLLLWMSASIEDAPYVLSEDEGPEIILAASCGDDASVLLATLSRENNGR